MTRVVARLAQTLPARRLGVAVSGGADSVALLGLLIRVAARHPLALTVLHVDHGLRPESGADARWVARLAKRLGVPFLCRRLPPPPACPGAEGGLEAWARRERLRALAELARQADLEWVALGHHDDDQAETILGRILRGTSLAGMGGMRRRQTLQVAGRPLRLWRPLLNLPRTVLRAWLTEIGQDWREDATNHHLGFERNRLRHEVLPFLETVRPGAARHLVALARDARRALRALAASARENGTTPICHGTTFSLAGPLPPVFVLAEQLRRWLIRLGEGDRLSRPLLHRLVDLARRPHAGRRLPLGNRVIVRTATGLEVLPGGARASPAFAPLALPPDTPVDIGGFRYLLAPQRAASAWEGCWIPQDRADAGLVIRSRRPGDRFRPAGGSGSKKLGRWLIDRKVPAHQRDGLILVTSGDDILWIPGLGRSAVTCDRPASGYVFLGRVALGGRKHGSRQTTSPRRGARSEEAKRPGPVRTPARPSHTF